MKPSEFIKRAGAETVVYCDEQQLLLAAVRQAKKKTTILVASTTSHTPILKLRYDDSVMAHLTEKVSISHDINDEAEKAKVAATSYPVAQRGSLGNFILDREANKLIDGICDSFDYSPQHPYDLGRLEETVAHYHASLVERETSMTRLAVANDRSVAQLGNAILFPLVIGTTSNAVML